MQTDTVRSETVNFALYTLRISVGYQVIQVARDILQYAQPCQPSSSRLAIIEFIFKLLTAIFYKAEDFSDCVGLLFNREGYLCQIFR